MYRSNTWTRSTRRLFSSRCQFSNKPLKGASLPKNITERHASSSSSKSSSNGIYLAASVATVGVFGAGAVIYAKYDDDFRTSVEKSLPFAKGLLQTLIGEHQSKEQLLPVEKDLSIPFEISASREESVFSDESSTVVPIFADRITPAPSEKSPSHVLTLNTVDSLGVSMIDHEMSNLNKPKKKEGVAADSEIQPSTSDVVSTEEKAVVQIDEALQVKGDPSQETPIEATSPETEQLEALTGPLTAEELKQLSEVADSSALEVVLNASTEYLKLLSESTVASYKKAADSIRDYIKQLSKAVLISNKQELHSAAWTEVSLLEQKSQLIIDDAKLKEIELNAELEGLMELMKSLKESGFDNVAKHSEELVKECNEKLSAVNEDMKRAENELKFFLDFQSIVENSPSKLQEELKKFTPDLIKMINLREDFEDLSIKDALLALALKRPEVVEAGASHDGILASDKFNELLSKQTEQIQKETQKNLSSELKKIEAEKNLELELRVKDVENHFEKDMLAQLKRQASAHNEHLAEELAKKSSELASKFKEEMDTKLSEQDEVYRQKLEVNVARVKGIHSKISDIVDVGQRQRRVQELWISSQALCDALEESLVNGRTRTLMPELLSIMHIVDGKNEVLQEIVESIPEAAALHGVVPEKDLLQRFKQVKRSCKKVALVGEEGASISGYLFSYIKSIFVYSGWYQYYADSEVNLDEIRHYEILAKADYYIQQGDLEQAAKFMSLLKGASRKMSSDWMNEVRLFLETKQTAQLLLSYTASLTAGGS